MTLRDFLDTNYSHEEDFIAFKERLGKMYEYAKRVQVLGWRDEFAIGDKNPEVVDEIRFWEVLLENGLVSFEEFQRKMQTLPYASKTIGVAFMDSDEVSFRERRPSLSVALHELGHCFFKKPDPVWHADYMGGEYLMWLIIRGEYDGDEEDIKKYMEVFEGLYQNPSEVLEKMERISQKLYKKYFGGYDLEEELNLWKEHGKEYAEYPNILKLCLCTGYIPRADNYAFSVLAHSLTAIHYRDFALVWEDFLRELIRD